MKRLHLLLAMIVAMFSVQIAAQERSWSEGPVSVVTAVRVEPGQLENYMNYLQSTYKPVMDLQKKEGVILDFSVYSTMPRTQNDPNLYLVVTYPNMASFDGLDERTEPLANRVTGMSRTQAAQAGAERVKMRTILGSELIRQQILK